MKKGAKPKTGPAKKKPARRAFTERKGAAEELKELNSEIARQSRIFNTTLSSIADFAYTFDREGRFTFVNQPLLDLWGLKLEEAVGKNFFELKYPEELAAKLQSQIQLVIETKAKIRDETKYTSPSGADGYYEYIFSPVFAGDGTVEFVTGCTRDITQRKQTEQALRAAQEELKDRANTLEMLVAERTASLRETIGELERFSYSVAHDLRAPLRAMQSFSSLLAEECGDLLNPHAKDYIRRITTSGARMDKLIRDVLNYSRIVRTPLPLDAVDVEPLFHGILESYEHLQSAHAKIDLEGGIPPLMANEAMLSQCISNLLGNAIKFVAPGVTPHVRVWADNRESRVRLNFRDNGIGIEKGMHERIFGIFERVDPSYEGTGIGLAIVKKAVERMGGTMGLESETGQGSTFWLELTAAPGGSA